MTVNATPTGNVEASMSTKDRVTMILAVVGLLLGLLIPIWAWTSSVKSDIALISSNVATLSQTVSAIDKTVRSIENRVTRIEAKQEE